MCLTPFSLIFFFFSPDPFWNRNSFETDSDLPAGWMRVRDTSGTYYWHIPTGTTQWEPPSPLCEDQGSRKPSAISQTTTPSEEQQVRPEVCATRCGAVCLSVSWWPVPPPSGAELPNPPPLPSSSGLP
uniref:WW domain-containing protein n=1 Tax=Latimeria chalumnae TaxID=7897 RepID=H3ABB9_LATCH